jgi:paraquat-inducible protein A
MIGLHDPAPHEFGAEFLPHTPTGEAPDHVRECQDCGLFQAVAPLGPGDAAHCRRCNATLRRGGRDSLNRALGCSIAALILLVLAVQLPIMDLRTVGRTVQASLFTGPSQLNDHGMWEVSVVVLITLVFVPFIQLLLILTVLLGLRVPHPSRGLPIIYGWVETLRPWSMIEVFLLGVFVAYTRLQAIADVQIGPALIALGGVMLCMIAADVELDHEDVWERMQALGLSAHLPPQPQHALIGCDCCRLVLRARPRSRCPRCRSRLRARKPFSLNRTWALMGAAVALYLPANIYPVMTVIRFGRGEPNTLLSGVIELVRDQMWPLALLVFFASITVPLFKLIVLATLLVMTGEGSASGLRTRTRLFRFIDTIGRWSMIDVFMLTILVALVHMGFIATVLPGLGAIAFASVVVLTMFAAGSFDPRLMWDAAAETGHDLDAPEYMDQTPPDLEQQQAAQAALARTPALS